MAASNSSKDEIATLTKELYSQGGYLPLSKFAKFLNRVPKKALKWISKHPNYFKISNTDRKEDIILGITKVTFCEIYASRPGKCLGCDSLHVCKFFALSNDCKFGTSCKFSHNFFENGQNLRILQKYHLQLLNLEELRCLFQKIENRCDVTIPTICKYFNYGNCKKKDCVCLHICRYYLMNKCIYGKHCKINHDFDARNYEILKMYGIASTSVSATLSKLRILYNFQSNTEEVDDPESFSEMTACCPGIKNNAICSYYLSFRCKFKDLCRYHHNEMPYQWQFKMSKNEEWNNYSDEWNEQIELKFCNLEIEADITDSKKSAARFQFDTMRCFIGAQEYLLHRLSTVSFKTYPSHLATTWIWYWKDNDSWMEYGSPNASSISVTNEDIEESYLDNPEGTMIIQIDDKHEAEINFQEMVQTMKNKDRDVLRRPKFISIETASELRKKETIDKVNRKNEKQLNCLPPNWELPAYVTDISCHYRVIEVDEISKEFKMVSDHFNASMTNAEITKIERIENGKLLEYYNWKKENMAKETSGKEVKELKLFHGTELEFIDAISKQGFDVRLSGHRIGSRYGKGSYFAKDAVYSHKCTYSTEGKHKIFLVNVLIGEYVEGNSTYVRPPPKNPNEKGGKLYDSCVDDALNPKLFVIFSNEQTYPAYIITYSV